MRYFFILGLALINIFWGIQLQAQTILSLEKCIQIALENNLTIKRAQNQVLAAKSNEKQSKFNFLPSLNANLDYNMLYGTTFDQSNGKLINTTTRGSSPRLTSDVSLFKGLQNHHILKQNTTLLKASEYDVLAARDNVEVLVMDLYLQVLMDQENIKINQERIELLQEQLTRAEKRVEAGVENMEQVYNLRSQIATEKLNRVNAQNQFRRDELALLQALQLEPDQEYEMMDINVNQDSIPGQMESFPMIKDQALNYSPVIKSSELQINAARRGIRIAKAEQFPELYLSGGIASRYSSNGAFDPVVGEVVPRPYFDQLDLNRYEYFAVGIRLPLFNQLRIKNQVELAEIDLSNAALSYKQDKMYLENQLQQAYLDLLAAQSTYQAASENLTALEQSYRFAEKSYGSGNTDFYSYLESLNNRDQAQLNLTISRYQFVLRKKILRVYTGY